MKVLVKTPRPETVPVKGWGNPAYYNFLPGTHGQDQRGIDNKPLTGQILDRQILPPLCWRKQIIPWQPMGLNKRI